MDNFYLEEAHKYISSHQYFNNVSDIEVLDSCVQVKTTALINLPSKFIEDGVTDIGVKSSEPVKFVFSENFPNKAPKILLRDDFPRCFPHINPSKEEVLPCIYDGDLSELLQQTKWFDAILDQLIGWLQKAASNSLMDLEQGWEPMRLDATSGVISYNKFDLTRVIEKEGNRQELVRYTDTNNFLCVDFESTNSSKEAILCVLKAQGINKNYIPCPIKTLSDFYKYSDSIGVIDIKKIIENCDKQNIHHDVLFCTLVVERPCNIINSDSKLELLNFAIKKAKPRKGKKRVLPECKVEMLWHISPSSPELLKNLSGRNTKLNQTKKISLLGCGSVGSKIGVHLARNGNTHFQCIDKDIFMPHNNARYGLSMAVCMNKARLLATSINQIQSSNNSTTSKDAFSTDYSNSRIIIDSTASFAVRNFLMTKNNLPPIISTGLYHQGRFGFLLEEGQNCKLCDLWAFLYLKSHTNELIREMLFDSKQDNVLIGQSCSSMTSIMSDDIISLHSSSFAYNIQNRLENGLSNGGKLIITEHNNGFLSGNKDEQIEGVEISTSHKGWSIRILNCTKEKMDQQSKAAGENETGGVLLGTIFLGAKVIVVSDILPPPKDSKSSPCEFIIGKDGLEDKITDLEGLTHGKVTYLGTWHSHPCGGSASQTDINTLNKLNNIRDNEPTVCLIWKPSGLEVVTK